MLLLFQVLVLACVWVIFFSLWYSPSSLLSLCTTCLTLAWACAAAGDSCVKTCNVRPPRVTGAGVSTDAMIASCMVHILLQRKDVGLRMRAVGTGPSVCEQLELSNDDICHLCDPRQCNAGISILPLSDRIKNEMMNLISWNSTACVYSDSSKLMDQIHLVSLGGCGPWDFEVMATRI